MANGIDVHGSLRSITNKEGKIYSEERKGFYISYLIGVLSLYRERKFVDD